LDGQDETLPFEKAMIKQPPVRRIYHCVKIDDGKTPFDIERKRFAQASWDHFYESGDMLPVHKREFKRTALDIGDKRALPYLKDLWECALVQMKDHDILCWTNDDVFLHPELTSMLRYYCSIWDVVTSQRCEFKHRIPEKAAVRIYAERGELHFGRDLFAATKSWLVKNWDDIPDFFLGTSDFDLCLAAMVRIRYGIKTDRRNIAQNYFPSELPRGYCSHQAHPSMWALPEYDNISPSQIHNRKLWREYARKYLPDLKFTEMNTI
jgi:hypothetical protein